MVDLFELLVVEVELVLLVLPDLLQLVDDAGEHFDVVDSDPLQPVDVAELLQLEPLQLVLLESLQLHELFLVLAHVVDRIFLQL